MANLYVLTTFNWIGLCSVLRPHQLDPGAVEFRRLTESNFHGVEVVD